MPLALFSCSVDIADPANSKEKKVAHQAVKNHYYFPLSEGQQEQLFDEFLNVCSYPEFNKFIIGQYTEQGFAYQRRHAVLNSVLAEEEYELYGEGSEESPNAYYNYMAFKDVLDRYGNQSLIEIIDDFCTSNYLNFNIYIPHYDEAILSYQEGDPIYVLNALYADALDTVSIDEYEDYEEKPIPVYAYQNYHVIGSGYVEEPYITEDFCRTHIVYVVSFRDEIVNWNHFAKGTQSVSDWLITTAVEYHGFGCLTPTEVVEESYSGYNVLRIPILHSKKTFKKPCDEKYDHFCKFGKPQKDVELETELEALYEFDPYRTSWMVFDAESNDQYIEVKSNTLGLNLEGHDFYVYDTTLVLPEGIIRIPAQISTYDPERNAQHIEMEYIAG